MFAKTIVLSDAFLDMPPTARCLYFTLSMFADDDGFVNSPKGIMRQCGSSEDDIKLLLAKKFVLAFDDGVIVIKHWRINNYLQKDRYSETKYLEDKAQLEIDDNKAYTFRDDAAMYTHSVYTQVSIGKDSIDNNIYGDSDESDDAFFDRIWVLYPKKKGKASVSKTQRKKLHKVGYDVLKICIDNYKSYIQEHGISEQYVMYGSSFFNKGYIDYLPDVDELQISLKRSEDGDWE